LTEKEITNVTDNCYTVLQMRFYFSTAGWVRGICCYVAGVMIDFCGFEYEYK